MIYLVSLSPSWKTPVMCGRVDREHSVQQPCRVVIRRSYPILAKRAAHSPLNATLYGRKENCCPTQVQGWAF